jgi:nitroreductase
MHNLRDGILVNPKQSAPASLEAYRDLMLTGRLFGLIAVRDRYDRPDTLRAGRVWQRAHLLATSRGIAARPANGAVELIDHQRSQQQTPRSADTLATFTRDPAWQPTFMFYMGYATQEAPASPRRWLEQVVV